MFSTQRRSFQLRSLRASPARDLDLLDQRSKLSCVCCSCELDGQTYHRHHRGRGNITVYLRTSDVTLATGGLRLSLLRYFILDNGLHRPFSRRISRCYQTHQKTDKATSSFGFDKGAIFSTPGQLDYSLEAERPHQRTVFVSLLCDWKLLYDRLPAPRSKHSSR